jgi:hypothetical protein
MVKRLEIDAIFFVIVGAFFGVFLVAYVKNQPVHFYSNAATQTDTTTTSGPTIIPSPTITFQPSTSSDAQISSDGTHKVQLKTIHNQDLTKTYEVSADDGPVIYTQTLGANENITLPFNAWEPENRYFFIQENLGSGPQVLVFNGDGTPFADGEQYLNLTAAYDKLGSPYTYDAATGWAGYNLIVINTKSADGSQGSSYWYELPYGSLLPLATKF